MRSGHDREILRLAVPAFGALVAEPLFLLGDSAIVGRLGTAPLGGLGVAGNVLTTVVNLCVFLAYGTTAAVSRRIGAGDTAGAVRQGVDGLWLATGLGVALVCVGEPLVPYAVGLLGGTADVAPYAVTYLRIGLTGLPGMLVVLAGTGVLRGLLDTRTPLVVAVTASVVNLGLNALLVLGLHRGVGGSAFGTALAQTGSGVVYVLVVVRGARRHGVGLLPDRRGVLGSMASGAGLFVRTALLRVTLLAATAVAARIGTDAIAAYQVSFAVWSLLALALDAVAIAGQALTGRFLGASDVAGARAATRRMVEWGAVVGIVAGLLVLALHTVLPYGFSTDPHVRSLIAAALLVVAVLQPLAGVVFALDGILIGAGDSTFLAVASIVSTAVFLPAACAVLLTNAGLTWLWCATGVWMLARFATLALRTRGDRWLVTGARR
ncbi:MAG: MATE family efflux transporter [Acidothermales bacterium]|nr:MATE family efflux transporter [Acidothermales bacterium]